MKGDRSTDEVDHAEERIEKTAVGPVEAYELDQIVEEMNLIATDSLPKLDRSTVRVEQVDRLEDGMRRVTISGEKSQICPTRGLERGSDE